MVNFVKCKRDEFTSMKINYSCTAVVAVASPDFGIHNSAGNKQKADAHVEKHT